MKPIHTCLRIIFDQTFNRIYDIRQPFFYFAFFEKGEGEEDKFVGWNFAYVIIADAEAESGDILGFEVCHDRLNTFVASCAA